MLEVGRQIRHQRGRADVGRGRFAQQHLAEDGAGQLDHIKARFQQRNTDHFKGFFAIGTGQADGTRTGCIGQHGFAHVARILGVRLPVFAAVAIAGQALHPLDDELVVIVGHAQGGARGGSRWLSNFLARQHRLDIAHRHGQQAVALRFDDAERGRELQQRRLFTRAHRHGKARVVEQGAARVVGQLRRQAQDKTRLHGKGAVEGGAIQEFRLFFVFCNRRRIRLAAALQGHGAHLRRAHGRGKLHAHGQEGDALFLRITALAAEFGREIGARLVLQGLRLVRGNAAGAGDALAPHERDLGVGGEAAFALQHGDGQRWRALAGDGHAHFPERAPLLEVDSQVAVEEALAQS